ncbi:MAG: FAD-dependent oxidoreductase [Phycisphaerae bacterium]
MATQSSTTVIIVGGGLGGALAAVYLGRAGHAVEVYEMRGDPRTGDVPAGRSINLAVSHRGLCALEGVGLKQEVLDIAVPMPGRMMHARDGRLTFQPYGLEGQANYSVSRGGLNTILLAAADRFDNVTLRFHHKCTDVDLDAPAAEFVDTLSGATLSVGGTILIGADGAFSVVRQRMQRLHRYDYRQDYLKHGYKELTIPPGPGGSFQLEKNALHIWPRRTYMMIALPNRDGSFTCTLFWPFEGEGSFEALKTGDDVLSFFSREFSDAVPLIPTLAEDYFKNPTGSLLTVRSSPWYYRDKVVMLGDACHAVVPFYGQGMNAAFEDVIVLSECIERCGSDWARVFPAYHAARKNDVDVLADLAIANFVEMRDRTGSAVFLLKKKMEKTLHRMFRRWYIPLYSMVSFTRTPYREAVARARRQDFVVGGVAAIVGTILAVTIVQFIVDAIVL